MQEESSGTGANQRNAVTIPSGKESIFGIELPENAKVRVLFAHDGSGIAVGGSFWCEICL
jgi:hypothetical protein